MTDEPQTTAIEDRIKQKTDLAVAGATEVSAQVGGLAFKDMGQVMEFSKLMAVSGQAVPKHLRGAPGACLAISLQALNWRMDPFAVANKSYMVNDRISYEAQLVQAVVEQRAPIKGRIKGEVSGEGSTRKWTLRCTSAEDGNEIIYEGPEIGKITTKNSPLWKADPDQQLWYYSVRAMCRRHFPDVLLGVYEKEEIEAGMKDVTPPTEGRTNLAQRLAAKPDDIDQSPAVEPEDISQDDGHWTDEIDTAAGFPGSEEFTEGVTAAQAGEARTDCPYKDDPARAADWLAGFDEAQRAED